MIHLFRSMATRFVAPIRLASLLLFTALACASLTYAAPGDTCTPPPSGMVSWWPGDDNANDITGGNDGSYNNFVAGHVGQAFSFNGSDQYIDLGDPATLRIGGSMTIDAWIQPGSVPDDDNFHNVLSKFTQTGGCGSSSAAYSFGLIKESGVVKLNAWLMTAAGDLQNVRGGVVPEGSFSHVAVTYEAATGLARLFVNGLEVQSGNVGAGGLCASNVAVVIGAEPSSPTGRYFQGLIDELEVFDRALSAAEIQSIYEAGENGKCKDQLCATPPPSMVSWYRAEGDATDSQGTNDGELQNGAATTTGDTGRVGEAFSFNGGDDIVSVGNPASLQFGSTQQFSMDAWVKYDSLDLSSGQYCEAGGCDMYIMRKGSSNGDGWSLLKQADNRFWLCLGDGCGPSTATTVVSTTVAQTGVWYHVAAVRDASEIAIYVNGTKEASNPLPTITNTDIATNFTIGQFSDGLIDEVEIFNRALSTTEIKEINDAGENGKCGGCVPAPTEMISWWRAEDNADDSQGANHGVFDAATFVDGMVGQAFSFNGSSDGVIIPDSPDFDVTDLTIDAWVRTANAGSGLRRIFSQQNTNVDYMALAYNNNRLAACLSLDGLGCTGVISDVVLNDDQWHHVAIARKASEAVRYYIDGALVQTAQTESSAPYAINAEVMIGRLDAATMAFYDVEQFFAGSIDEVEFFNRALSGAEIYSIYCAGSRGKCASSGVDLDFGDAPDPYPTLFADEGARHAATGPLLGTGRDTETNGQPSDGAVDDGDDEDGITTPIILAAGKDDIITVTIGESDEPVDAFLNVWIDLDNDGSWDEAGDQILLDQPVTSGTYVVAVPGDATKGKPLGTYYGRVRICSTTENCNTPTGAADDGEVEDYAITLSKHSPGSTHGGGDDDECDGAKIFGWCTGIGAADPWTLMLLAVFGLYELRRRKRS